MSEPAYLSIDIDYFNKGAYDPWLLEKAFQLSVPLCVCVEHHDILPHVEEIHEKFGVSKLINVDYHSDFFSTQEPLHCGNWVNYVSWREIGNYEWVLPRMNDYHLRWGYCHVGANNPFWDPQRWTGWKTARMREGYGPDLFDNICGIGICISPNYLDEFSDSENTFLQLHKLMKKKGIPVVLSQDSLKNNLYYDRLVKSQPNSLEEKP